MQIVTLQVMIVCYRAVERCSIKNYNLIHDIKQFRKLGRSVIKISQAIPKAMSQNWYLSFYKLEWISIFLMLAPGQQFNSANIYSSFGLKVWNLTLARFSLNLYCLKLTIPKCAASFHGLHTYLEPRCVA